MLDVETRLRRMEDLHEIREVISRYGPAADSGDAEGVASLWAEDGRYSVGGMGEVAGRAAVAGLITGSTHRDLIEDGCGHILSAPTIELYGDTASARCYSVVFRHEGGTWAAARVSANRWELRRYSGQWLVTNRENSLLDGSPASREILSSRSPDDHAQVS